MVDSSIRSRLKPRSTLAAVVFVICMIGVIVAMDLLFFRGADMTLWRFIANLAVVLVSGVLYVKFIAR